MYALVDATVSRARRLAGLMFHSLISRSPDIILPVYFNIVRPILEYATVIWNPHLISQIDKIEKVQRYVTKRITGFSNLSYEDRLNTLHLPSLSHRREYFDLLEVYKSMKGYSYVSNVNFTLLSDRTRGHALRLRQQPHNLNIRKVALFVRAVIRWNSLPSEIVDAQTLIIFKRMLRKHMFTYS